MISQDRSPNINCHLRLLALAAHHSLREVQIETAAISIDGGQAQLVRLEQDLSMYVAIVMSKGCRLFWCGYVENV
jgi:hypothetical protein